MSYIDYIKSHYPIHGNDLSTYQIRPGENMDYERFMRIEAPKFVILRGSVGSSIDEDVAKMAEGFFLRADIGLYFPILANVSIYSHLLGVQKAWDKVGIYSTVRPWVDIETKVPISTVKSVVNGVDAITGCQAGIYTNPNYTMYYGMAEDPFFNSRQLWLANYGVYSPSYKPYWKPHLWQYTSSLDGQYAGVHSSGLDGDVFFLEPERYNEILIAEPEPEPTPEYTVKNVFISLKISNGGN